MWQAVLDAIESAFQWILDGLIALGTTVLGWLLALLPTSFTSEASGAYSTIAFGISAANQWLPLDLSLSLFLLWMTFLLSATAVKYVRQLIP